MVSVCALQCCAVTIHMVPAAVSSSGREGFGFRSRPACSPSELHPSQQPRGSSRAPPGQAICSGRSNVQQVLVFISVTMFVFKKYGWLSLGVELDQRPPSSVVRWLLNLAAFVPLRDGLRLQKSRRQETRPSLLCGCIS